MEKKLLQKFVGVGVIALVVGFVAGMEYKSYQIRSAFGAIADAFDVETEEETPVDLAEVEVIEKGVGESIELATIKFTVNSVEEAETLSREYAAPLVASEGAKFVVLNLSITNITNEAFTNTSDGFVITDEQGRSFTASSDANWVIDNALEYRELAPSITEKGDMVFEVPDDATSYGLVIGKDGTEEYYRVTLR